MKIFSGLRMFALLALGLMAMAIRVEAQNFSLLVTAPLIVGVSNSFNFVISITNLTGISQTVTVTNMLTGTPLQFNNPTAPTATQGSNVISGSNVIFFLGAIATNGTATMNLPVVPTSAGYLTNMIVLATNGMFFGGSTNPTVVQVTNAISVADLAVAMTGPASQVFTNDWMVYGVSVTNLGPGTATGVFLTNTLPPGVGYKSVSPALTRLGSGSNIIFNLGTLASGAFTNLQLTVQPTNAGTWTFFSVVSTNSVLDPNPTNNSASINVAVSNFLSNPGQLTATIVSTQKFNQLSGRLEQSIVLSNAGPTSVDSARVTVTGLTNWLSNAMGTNNGNPFVTYASALTNGQGGAYLLLQFYPNQNPFPFTNAQMRADGVTMPNLAPPASGLMPTNILLIARLSSGGMFLEFPTLTNRAFTVEYTSNLLSEYCVTNYIADTNNPGVTNIVVYTNSVFSTNWLVAQPVTVTPANYTAWIDYGPPATVSHPTNTPMRFYRVFLNP